VEKKEKDKGIADVDGEKGRRRWWPLPCACVEAPGHGCQGVEKPVNETKE
jgi:hypothetical protein